jgi:hypothetical protein
LYILENIKEKFQRKAVYIFESQYKYGLIINYSLIYEARITCSRGLLSHAHNPSYPGGRNQEDSGSKPTWANSSGDPISKRPITKKGYRVTQVVKASATVKFYSATKKNETLSLAGKWKELENNILNEVSQAQKAKSSMFSLTCGL